MKRLTFCLLGLMLLIADSQTASFFVSAEGSSRGIGTVKNPWDLQTALNHPKDVLPGDTIWISGGIYHGVYTSKLEGRDGSPIIVRAMPGEKVVLDGNVPDRGLGVLSIMGKYSWFWGLTITSSNTDDDNRRDGVYFMGPFNKVINCHIHNNGGNGVAFWRPARDSEVYGCVIYHNGYRGSFRGHGHGIYAQNDTGTKLIRNNILFNSFGIGIHIYTEEGSIQGFVIEGNTIFNSGLPGSESIDRNILIGGMQPADRIHIRNNIILNRPKYSAKASVQLGYSVANRNAEFSDNILLDGSLYAIRGWNSLQINRNQIYSTNTDISLIAFDDFSKINNPVINNNAYFGGSLNFTDFKQWRDFSGQDMNSSYNPSVPKVSTYQISANRYEKGRGHVTVLNWGNMDFVTVNLSSVLNAGQEFQVWDVLNMSGGPVLSGKYNGGTIEVPMRLTEFDLPVRENSNKNAIAHTLPLFGTFLITPVTRNGFNFNQNVSNVLPIKINKIYPNPTVDIVAVDFYSPSRSIVKVEVLDDDRKIYYTEDFIASFGDNKLILNLATLPAGVYIISLSNGEQTATANVLKRAFGLSINKEKNTTSETESF